MFFQFTVIFLIFYSQCYDALLLVKDCKINYSLMALRVRDWVQWYEGFKIMN